MKGCRVDLSAGADTRIRTDNPAQAERCSEVVPHG